jgi:hypothetical protein
MGSNQIIEIMSIDDLKDHEPDFLEKVRAELALHGIHHIFQRQSVIDGYQQSLTMAQYADAVLRPEAFRCRHCEGEGYMPAPAPRTVGTIHASSIHRCPLFLQKDLLANESGISQFSVDLRLIFAYGHTAHSLYQNTLKDAVRCAEDVDEMLRYRRISDPGLVQMYRKHAEYLSHFEFQFEDEAVVDVPELLVEGSHTDGIFSICLLVDNKIVRVRGILEIKTMGEDGFDKLTKPKTEHVQQAGGVYATGLDAPFVVFVYIGKKGSSSPMKSWTILYPVERYLDLKQKVDSILEAVSNNKDVIAVAAAYECSDCSYKETCAQRVTNTRRGIR